MEKAPLLISITTSHYFCLPIFNKIFEILFAKILFQKRRQSNVRMLKTGSHSQSEIYGIPRVLDRP